MPGGTEHLAVDSMVGETSEQANGTSRRRAALKERQLRHHD